MKDRMPKELADPPIDFTRGVFRFGGKELVLIGEHVHEVLGRHRHHINGQKLVLISARCRKATEEQKLAARRAND